MTLQKEYFELIKKQIFSSASTSDSVELFEKFNDDIQEYLSESLPVESLGMDSNDSVLSLFIGKENFKERKFLAMPASEHTVNQLESYFPDYIELSGFVDNFKHGSYQSVPVLKPEEIKDCEFDYILIMAMDFSLQKSMQKQLQEILPESDHHKIILLGTGYLKSIFSIKENIEQQAKKINIIKRDKEHIVFALMKFPVQSLPLVKELRRQGYSVSLLIIDLEFGYGSDYTDYEHCFDTICHCDHFFDFFLLLTRIKVDILYTIDFSCQTFFCLLIRIIWQKKLFHEVYGFGSMLNIFIRENGNQADIASHHKHLLALENYARPKLFNSVNGILYRGSSHFEEAFKEQYKIKVPLLHYQPYPDGDMKFSFYSGNQHIAWCGHHPGKRHSAVAYGVNFYDLIKDIVAQGIHFHSYNTFSGEIEEYSLLEKESRYFHLEKPLPFDTLPMMLRRYDWGCMAFYFDENDPRSKTYAASFASRFLAYVSAGIPIICSKEYVFMVEVIEEYNNGIVVGRRDIPNLLSILKEADMDYYNKNAKRAKEALNIQKQYPLFASFLNN